MVNLIAKSPKVVSVVFMMLVIALPLHIFTFTNAASSGYPLLKLDGYIWESPDGSAVDSNSQLAAKDTALTGVRKGEAITLRAQILNEGDAAANSDLALFYDKNDGVWTKVDSHQPLATGAGDCDTVGGGSADWECTTIDATDNVGYDGSLAFDPAGNPWISYYDGGTNGNLEVVSYVGSGGNCDTVGGGSDAWNCTTVDATDDVGEYTSMAFDQQGTAWIAYHDGTNGNLEVAKFVGSGGNCDSVGGGSDAWQCTTVVSTDNVALTQNSIAIDSSGNPWIAYHDGTNGDLEVAQYVGSGGSGCNSSAWTCTIVDSTDDVGEDASIAFDQAGDAWVSYRDFTNKDLMVAQYVGSGGSGCNSSAWTCTLVDATGEVGMFTSIAIDPAGNPWVSQYVDSSGDLEVAQYVGSGGSGCNSSAWTCTAIDTTDTVGTYTSMAFDPSGNPWISYRDFTNGNFEVAYYVGSNGNCDSVGAGSDAWQCTTVDATDNVGSSTALAFDSHGNPWVSYRDITNGNLELARMKRSGEIITASTGETGTISESHTDMTSTTDTTNRDDADCITGSTTWNNGKATNSAHINSLGLPAGDTTKQCTEVAWTIDTSQASLGQTYRFAIASKDAVVPGKGIWRGLTSYSSYPTLTIKADSVLRYSQGVNPIFANCTDTSWGCEVIDATSTVGVNSSLDFDSNGNPWVSYHDFDNGNLEVANYVGSGGNCDTVGGGSDAWQCTTVDETDTVGGSSSLAIGHDGTIWVSYYDSTGENLEVAYYVGSGGNCDTVGGGSDAWQCTTVDDTNNQGDTSRIAIDHQGNPWVVYWDFTALDLKLARYVGSGGNCDTVGGGSDAWQCSIIDDDNSGRYGSIAFDSKGVAWVSYRGGSNDLRVAKYVGTGGDCGTSALIQVWKCYDVDTTGATGDHSFIAIDHNDDPWVSFNNDSNDLEVAKYVGSGGNCDTTGSGSDAWQCTIIDATDSIGRYNSIAFDTLGNAWVSYNDTTNSNLELARFVGSGGNCDTVGGGSDAWECTTLHNDIYFEGSTSLAFDNNGIPWVAVENNSSDLVVAKLHINSTATPLLQSKLPHSRSAHNAEVTNRYIGGTSPYDASQFTNCASSDQGGYCGVASDDGYYQTVTTNGPNEQPYSMFIQKFSSNSTLPTITWTGATNLAPSTAGAAGDIKLEVYRHGSTNAWEALASDSSSTNCSSDNCTISAMPSGTPSEYFEQEGSDYYLYVRAYQEINGSTTIIFKTDRFIAQNNSASGLLRHGAIFREESYIPGN